ncbi:MAG: phosphatase PAP2 family protein [Gemmatimonadales bacterium]
MISLRPHPRTVLVLLALFVLVSVLMVLGVTLPIDEAAMRWLGAERTPARTEVMLFFTFIGNGMIEVPLALLAAWALYRLGRPRCAKRYVFAALSAEVVYAIAKPLFRRDRPQIIERLADAGWYSYPSGHAMLAPVIYGFALVLLAKSVPSRTVRLLLIATSLLIPPLIALSRVYLGVHYPSDVVGALFLGNAWLLLWTEAPERSSSDATSSLASTR